MHIERLVERERERKEKRCGWKERKVNVQHALAKKHALYITTALDRAQQPHERT